MAAELVKDALEGTFRAIQPTAPLAKKEGQIHH